MSVPNDIMVSVCMITYNHEKYIIQAIEGVMMQQTTFPIELIIGEDCSTDNTRKICLKYKANYPELITLRLPESNLGIMKNFTETMYAANGKYIALCEGDDYWTDPYKLQKQVDFLEANEEYSICFHPVKIWKDGEIIDDYITREVPETTTILDLAEGNYIHTPSVVFRRNQEVFDNFQSMGALAVGDYVLHMLNAKYGKIRKMPEIMGVYRVHGGGVHSQKSEFIKSVEWILMLDNISPLFDCCVVEIFKQQKDEILNVVLSNILQLSKNDKDKLFEKIIIDNSEYFYLKISELNFLKNENQIYFREFNSLKMILRRFWRVFLSRIK